MKFIKSLKDLPYICQYENFVGFFKGKYSKMIFKTIKFVVDGQYGNKD